MIIGEMEVCDLCGKEIKDGEGRYRLTNTFCKCENCGDGTIHIKAVIL